MTVVIGVGAERRDGPHMSQCGPQGRLWRGLRCRPEPPVRALRLYPPPPPPPPPTHTHTLLLPRLHLYGPLRLCCGCHVGSPPLDKTHGSCHPSLPLRLTTLAKAALSCGSMMPLRHEPHFNRREAAITAIGCRPRRTPHTPPRSGSTSLPAPAAAGHPMPLLRSRRRYLGGRPPGQ